MIGIKQETVEASAKATPAIGGAAYAFTELPLNELVAAATFIYVVLQIGLLIPKYYKIFKHDGEK